MTFKQAAAKLKKIANGKYHSLRFELTTYKESTQAVCGIGQTKCDVYIEDLAWYSGATWAEAFEALDTAMNPKPVLTEEIPNISDKEATTCPK
jgi:hypothetical protein